jgi:hypothetical protein
MRLNLGCGLDIKEGYTNVDIRSTHPSVTITDLSNFPWPFEDNSTKEILMLDFLEHFPYKNTQRILMECYRILEDDGSVVIQVPDVQHLTAALTKTGGYLCNRDGGYMISQDTSLPHLNQNLSKCPTCQQSADEIAHAAMMRMYGGQDYPGNFHYTCFTEEMLDMQCRAVGFGDPASEEEMHQYANWNFKRRYTKGDLW